MRKKSLKKPIATKLVARCSLGKVELDVTPISLILKAQDRTEKTFVFRCLFPEMVDGKPFFEGLCCGLMAAFEQSQGEEKEFYCWVIQMLWFEYIFPELDERRTRPFYISSLDWVKTIYWTDKFRWSKTFRSMAEMTKTEGLSSVQRLKEFAKREIGPTVPLLRKAIFKQPEIDIPFSEEVYVLFREQVLREILNVMLKLKDQKREGVRELKRRIRSNKKMSRAGRQRVLAKVRAVENGQDDNFVQQVSKEFLHHLFSKSQEMEAEFATQFTDLVERARELQEPVAKELERRGIEMLSEDGEGFIPEAAECIKQQFDKAAVDALLDDLILRYEKVCMIPSREAVEDIDEEIASFPGGLPFGPQFYLGLVRTRETGDILEKWNALGWVSVELVNRNECVRRLCREAEAVWLGVLEFGFKQVYRKISGLLSIPDRRAYALMYFRQPIFDYGIAAFDPVIMSFFNGMDKETRAMIIMRMVFKVDGWDGMKAIGKELEERWRAYLWIYPFWVVILETDEEEHQQEKRELKKTRLPSELIRGQEGETITVGEVVADIKGESDNLLQNLVLEERRGLMEEWMGKHCTRKQVAHILKRYRDGKTEVAIAEEEGVSHQAVSKSINTAIRSIREGLKREGKFELYRSCILGELCEE